MKSPKRPSANRTKAPEPKISAARLVPRMPAQEIEDAKLEQREAPPAMDRVDEALMESFPCSDPPGYINTHL